MTRRTGPMKAECYEDTWYIFGGDGNVMIADNEGDGTGAIARMRGTGAGLTLEQQQANAELFAEAGSVLHETGLTPRQLQEKVFALQSALDASRAREEGLEGALEQETRKNS